MTTSMSSSATPGSSRLTWYELSLSSTSAAGRHSGDESACERVDVHTSLSTVAETAVATTSERREADGDAEEVGPAELSAPPVAGRSRRDVCPPAVSSLAMKIRSVRFDNRRQAFHVVTATRTYELPYAAMDRSRGRL